MKKYNKSKVYFTAPDGGRPMVDANDVINWLLLNDEFLAGKFEKTQQKVARKIEKMREEAKTLEIETTTRNLSLRYGFEEDEKPKKKKWWQIFKR